MYIIDLYKAESFWKKYWQNPVENLKKAYIEDADKNKTIKSYRYRQKMLAVLSIFVSVVIFVIAFYYVTDFWHFYYSEKNPIFAERFIQQDNKSLIWLYRIIFVGIAGGLSAYVATWFLGKKHAHYENKIKSQQKDLLAPNKEKTAYINYAVQQQVKTLFDTMSHTGELIKFIRQQHEKVNNPFVEQKMLQKTLARIHNQQWSIHDMYVFANAITETDMTGHEQFKMKFYKNGKQHI